MTVEMRSLFCFVLVIAASQGETETIFKFNDTSILSMKEVNITYDDALVVNFYDETTTKITAFKWFNNRIYIEDCKDLPITTSSRLYVLPSYRYSRGENRTWITVNISFYKSHNRFLVLVDNTAVLTVDDPKNCSSVLDRKVNFVGVLNPFEIESVKCGPGYYLNNSLICNKCPRDTYSTHKDVECIKCPGSYRSREGSSSQLDCKLKNYKGYYIHDEETSMLHIVTRSDSSYSYNDLRVTFYDINRKKITHFEWDRYNNYIQLGDCKQVTLTSSDPYYREYGYRYEKDEIFNLAIYKSDSKFTVTESGKYFFGISKPSDCSSSSCDDLFATKIKYIGFSGDERVTSFYSESFYCKAGFYLDQTLNCNTCPPNTYSTNKDMECQQCPMASRSAAGSKTFNDCKLIKCPAGHVLSIDGNCTICPNGTYSSKGQVVCTYCPDGNTSPPGSTNHKDCKGCISGSAFNSLTKTCEQCPSGTYSGGNNSKKCNPCPSGKTSNEGSTLQKDCYWKCQPGEIITGNICEKCPQDSYSAGNGATWCRRCPSNTTAPVGSIGKINCTKIDTQ